MVVLVTQNFQPFLVSQPQVVLMQNCYLFLLVVLVLLRMLRLQTLVSIIPLHQPSMVF